MTNIYWQLRKPLLELVLLFTPFRWRFASPRAVENTRVHLREPLIELVFLFIPLRWRFAARAACKRLRLAIDAQAVATVGFLRPSIMRSNSRERTICLRRFGVATKLHRPIRALMVRSRPLNFLWNLFLRYASIQRMATLDVANHAIRPVLELKDTDQAAVSCMCFGQERLHNAYVVLAVGTKKGHALIFHCRRNQVDRALLVSSEYTHSKQATRPPLDAVVDVSGISLHRKLMGHTRHITSIKFNSVREDRLITASLDKTMRLWNVVTGQMLCLFRDSSPVLVAECLPWNPEKLIASNSAGRITLVSTRGLVLQRFTFEGATLTTAFDDAGLIWFAGTSSGKIIVFGVSGEGLDLQYEVKMSEKSLNGITFAPAGRGSPACLFLSCSDASVKIVDCIYDPSATNRIVDLAVRRSLGFAHTFLPLKACYCSFGGGNFVSASEGKDVCIYSLAGGFNHRIQRLRHHKSPVVAVAVNYHNTFLVSADARGLIVVWRRMYS